MRDAILNGRSEQNEKKPFSDNYMVHSDPSAESILFD